ncbi:MAG: glycosyltransferase [Elusimicrobiota bacterium]
MIINHLIPEKGHSSFYDRVSNSSFFALFEKIYIFKFEDPKNWPPKIKKVIKRNYHIDTEYYTPITKKTTNEKITIFSGGLKGRDFEKLIKAVDNRAEIIILTNSSVKENKNTKILKLNKNLFNIKEIISKSDFSVIPISDTEMNETAGMAIAFISMAMGKPVLIRKTKYMEEYIKDGVNGFLYNEISELKLKISEIIKKREDLPSIGMLARKTITEKASLDKFAQKLLSQNTK